MRAMTNTMISVEGLGKQYELGVPQAAYTTLRETLVESLRAPLRMARGHRRETETIWAIRDVNFEVGRGEVVALVGKNAASAVCWKWERASTPS